MTSGRVVGEWRPSRPAPSYSWISSFQRIVCTESRSYEIYSENKKERYRMS